MSSNKYSVDFFLWRLVYQSCCSLLYLCMRCPSIIKAICVYSNGVVYVYAWNLTQCLPDWRIINYVLQIKAFNHIYYTKDIQRSFIQFYALSLIILPIRNTSYATLINDYSIKHMFDGTGMYRCSHDKLPTSLKKVLLLFGWNTANTA